MKGLWGQKGRPPLGLGLALVLQWTLPWPYNTTNMVPLYIGYIFALYATKKGSRGYGDTKVNPHWVWDPSWSFNGPCHGPCHGPTIHPTWPFMYWIYFLHSTRQKWDQGTLRTQRATLIRSRTCLGPSMDPAKAIQYT